MAELERRALLGDTESQRECTEKGIVLPCPCCGGEAKLKKGFPSRQIAHCRQAVVQCKRCGVRTVTYKQLPFERWEDVDYSALSAWNTRQSSPMGRCVECVAYIDSRCANTGYYKSEFGFCDDFEPKDGEENAAD